jgi:beta-phosphoglucomutase
MMAGIRGVRVNPLLLGLGQMLPGLGHLPPTSGLLPLEASSDGRFLIGQDGVRSILVTADGKVEFISFAHHTLACVTSALGYPAYYPVHPVTLEKPLRALLMDLDGTSVRSEGFWVGIIQQTTASLLGDPGFRLSPDDQPFVSGNSVSEHLAYCLGKYAPGKTVEEAREVYFRHVRREMQAILDDPGSAAAAGFQPAPGLKPFLLALKARGIKIGLVTSGLHEKAYPEIVAAFRAMDLGDPRTFYDAIITAGFPLGQGEPGTLGELSPKPHPWLYAEAARVGLGIPFEERGRVVGLEDSGAGICAIRLAGFSAIGMAGGNIVTGGATALCHALCTSFDEVLEIID